MSIYVTSLVWKFSKAEGSTLLTALAIADFADDDGRAFPAVATLAKKARISERSVQYALATLRDLAELRIDVGSGPHGCNTYLVQVQNLRGANSAGVQNTAERGATGCTQTTIEPSQKKKERATIPQPVFDPSTGNFSNLDEHLMGQWAKAYPLVNVKAEIERAAVWLLSNPRKDKTDYRRFLNNWLGKAQKDIQFGRGARIPARSQAEIKTQQRQAFSDHFNNLARDGAAGESHDVIDGVATEVH